MTRTGEFVVFAISAVFVSFALRILIKGGYFQPKVLNHAPGPCRVFDVNGTEDVEILPSGLAFFSSGTRYCSGLICDSRIVARIGRIYMFDMNHPERGPVEVPLVSFDRTGFNPHGISLYTNKPTGEVSVFVVNHRLDAQAIEIFDFDEKTKSLVFRRSVVDETINSPNDVVAVGPDSFYVTNDRYFHFDKTVIRFVELLFLNTWLKSGVVFYDGTVSRARHVAGGITSPNGITISVDGRFVIVADGLGAAINIYRRGEDNSLTLVQVIEVGILLDNINIDQETGDLWICSIPRGLNFAWYNEDLDRGCPSQVLSVRLNKEHAQGVPFPAFEIRDVYANNGSEIKGTTGAAVYGGKLAVAAIFDNFMVCELNAY